MEYYNFADGQSITTIKTATKKTVNSSDSVNSTGIGKSVYVPEGSVAVSRIDDEDMDIDEDDAIGDKGQGPEFVFDLDALKEIEKATLANSTEPNDKPPSTSIVVAPTTKHTTMSVDDSKAIQEQLTLALVSRSKASDALHLGEESMELELPETPTFAVVLEDITNKDYSIMLDIIKSISSAIPKSAEDDEPRTEIPDNIQHHLFTQALRDALKSDLIGSDESLSEYLDCMIMAIEDAQKITEGYLTDSNDVDMENEATNTPLLLLPASESDDTAAKLQGCAEDTDTNMTTAEAVGETSIVPADTARLGADQE